MTRIREIDRRHPDLIPLVILLLLGIGFFFPVLFLGKAPAMNSMRKVEPWRTERIDAGDGTVEYEPNGAPKYTWKTAEGFADDLNRQFIPWGLYCQERIKSGEFPYWNPHVSSGQPMFANHQTGITNPWILLCYLIFPGIHAFTAIFLGIFVFCGWAMYGYLRSIGLKREASLLGAVTYQFILGYIPTLDTLIIEKALFPLLLYSIEMAFRTEGKRSSLWILSAIFTLSLVQTTCHVQEAVFISYLIGPYILFVAGGSDSIPKGKKWASIFRRFIFALGIYISALLVGFFQNFATLEFYQNSTRAVGFLEEIENETVLEASLSWIQSLMIAFPKFFGDYLEQNGILEHYLLNYGYIGIFTLAGIPFAGWIKDSRRQVIFFSIIAWIFYFALISNWWYFEVLCKIPLFRLSLQKPFSPLFFSLVILGAHGFQFFLSPHPKGTIQNKRMGYAVLGWLALTLGIGIITLFAKFWMREQFDTEQVYVFSQIGIGATTASIAMVAVSIGWRFFNQRDGKNRSGKFIINTITGVLFIIILLDLWPVKSHFNPFVERKDIFASTKLTDLLIEKLKWEPGMDGPYRFGRSWNEFIPPNMGMVYKLDDFGGYDSNLPGRYGELLESVDKTILKGVHFIENPRYRSGFNSKVWDMLGVKYIGAHPGHSGQFGSPEQWENMYLDETNLIVENKYALPRFQPVYRIIETTTRENFLHATLDTDPSRYAVVLIEDTPSVWTSLMNQSEFDSSILDGAFPPESGSLIVKALKPEYADVIVNMKEKGMLCYFENWYPGWKVRVNGTDRKLEVVNYTFKGVVLDKGLSRVEFYYEPTWLRWGILGSIIGVILSLLVSMVLARVNTFQPLSESRQ